MGSVYSRCDGKAGKRRIYYYTVKIAGRWREFAGYTDKGATQTLMRDHQRRVERGEVGLVDPFEAGKGESLADLVKTYVSRPDAAGQNPRHLVCERERLLLAFAEMQVTSYLDIVGLSGNDAMPKAEQFFTKLQLGEVRPGRPTHEGGKPKPRKPASPATVRGYKVTLKAFGRYLQRRGTWPSNPFEMLQAKKLTAADRTRVNRALTPEQIDALVQAAPQRAVQQWRKTHPNASAEHLEALRIEGVYRGRIYLALAYTGLRIGELAALTWGELDLTAGQEVAEIEARKQKGRDDAMVVLHPMLAEMLRRHRKECSAAGVRAGRGPVRNQDRVFRVSSSLLRWLKLDAKWAGIGLTDARGRSTTVHGIRAGFNTTLRRNATDPALRMRLMRHKTAELTFGTYDKVEIDELRRELERLPVATTLRMAAGSDYTSVPVTVPSRPVGAGGGRCGPDDAPSTAIAESANVAHTRPSWPELADAGRSGPVRDEQSEVVGPAGLEIGAAAVPGCATERQEVPRSATLRSLRQHGHLAAVPPSASECHGVTAAVAHCIAHSCGSEGGVNMRRRGGALAPRRITLMFPAPRGLMSGASQNARWTHQRGLRGTNHEPTNNMTTTDSAPATDPYAAQLEQLKVRYKHVREPILVALNILMHDQNISVDDAKAQAALHGARITAASLNAARTLLSRMDAPTPATARAAATPAPTSEPTTRRAPRRPRAPQAPLDAEAMIRGMVDKLQTQSSAEAERLREAMRKAIAVLQAADG